MNIKKYNVYLADLSPRFGSEPGKTRPVVVVQTDLLNEVHPSTIILPITSNVFPRSTVLRIHLKAGEANLDKDSDIMVDQIRAIDNRRFLKHIGQLNDKTRRQLDENLILLLSE